MSRLLKDLRCPICKGSILSLENEVLLCKSCGRNVATYCPNERRFVWDMCAIDPDMEKSLRGEIGFWDADNDTNTDSFEAQPNLAQWLAGTRTMQNVARHFPELHDVRGRRILDIGATCRYGVRFLKSAAAELHQVEVSSGSQRRALRRLQEEGIDWQERVIFHTIMAEHLPFADESFDLVFSSGTIHHTDRKRSLPEIHRVLRKGGIVFFIEYYLSNVLRKVMARKRRATHADRGTDLPLDPGEIKSLKRLFPLSRCDRFGILWLPWTQTFHRLRSARRFASAISSLDENIGNFCGLGNFFGTQCCFVGKKQ